ncbi:enoyl-CoA hydratase-related protein [Pseudogracilibacillus sp. SO30301A]|uniref:enoyl-CoA hydratase-related protein n=1 Tax=Pseudogracilibacillus sp. SO30301A TaxID=3098291 RepID=UPI00300E3169
MSYEFVHVSYEKNLALVEIDSPPANALSSNCIRELRAIVSELDQNEDVFAVIITGHGRFFVAGADIKEFIPAMGDKQKGLDMAEAGQALCDEIENMRKPVIAAVNGPALGGGLELAMACHIRLAAKEAIFGLPELNLGLIPAFGGTQRLSRLTSLDHALHMILTSEHVSAEEAKSIGLVREVVEKDLVKRAKELALSYVEKNSTETVSRAVEAVVKGYKEPLKTGLKREQEFFGELFLTEDAKEGVEAFSEKRSPNFKHS